MQAATNIIDFPVPSAAHLTTVGEQMLAQGEIGAIEKFLAALEIDNRHADAWNGLGVALFSCGELERAEHAFSTALICNENDVTTACNLGQVFLRQGRLCDAANVVTACLQREPGAPDALALMQRVAADPARLDGASRIELARAMCWAGQLIPAAEVIGEAIAADPNVPGHRLLFAIATAIGDHGTAINAARAAALEDPYFTDMIVSLLEDQNDYFAEGALTFDEAKIPFDESFVSNLETVYLGIPEA